VLHRARLREADGNTVAAPTGPRTHLGGAG
jgi:hypothetical protein